MKCHNDVVLSWSFVCIPAFVVEAAWLLHLGNISLQWLRRKLDLNGRQIMCLAVYWLSIGLALFAEILVIQQELVVSRTAGDDAAAKIATDRMHSVLRFSTICWISASLLFIGAALTIINQEVHRVARARGHTDPIPLARSHFGWIPLRGYRVVTSPLLGKIRVRKENRASQGPLGVLDFPSVSTSSTSTVARSGYERLSSETVPSPDGSSFTINALLQSVLSAVISTNKSGAADTVAMTRPQERSSSTTSGTIEDLEVRSSPVLEELEMAQMVRRASGELDGGPVDDV
jgi:hypothetical protein